MKKRLVLALLLVAMVCALFTVTSLAADAHDHTSHEGWTAFTEATATVAGGKYYLEDDLNLASAKGLTNVTLCLNGHTVTAGTDARAFNTSGTVVICDCTSATTKGYINPTSGLWTKGDTVPSGATAYDLKGGIITGGYYEFGGAIYNSGNLTLDGVNVVGNNTLKTKSGDGGGAVFTIKDTTLTLKNTTLAGNVTTKEGGALYAGGTVVIGEGSRLEYNRAVNTTTYTLGAGGAIQISTTGKVTLNDCSVSYNTTGYRGGGICAYGPLVINSGAVISNNKTTATAGNYGGGAVYISAGTLTMNGGKVTGNHASRGGGGGIQSLVAFTMNGGEISGNTTDKTGHGGTGVNVQGGTFTMNGGEIKNNTVTSSGTGWSGGAVFTNSSGIFIMNGGKLINNANNGGYGGIYNQGKTTINGGEISGNSGAYAGAIGIYGVAGGSVTINGGVIKNNTNTGTGAQVVHTVGGSAIPVTINGGLIGGTMSLTNSKLTFTINGGTFKTKDLSAVYDVSAKVNTAKSTWNAANGQVHLLPELCAAEIYDGNTLMGSYENLKTAISISAGTGYTVKMFKDFEDTTTSGTTYSVSVKDYIILDLNGHTVSIPNGYGFVVRGGTGVTKVFSSAAEKGVMKVKALAVYISMGGIHLENLEIICPGAQAVGMEDITGNYNGKNIIKNCVLYNENWHTFSFNKNNGDSMAKAMLIVENTDIVAAGDGSTNHATGNPIGIQTKAQSAQLKLGEGVRLFTKGTTPVGTQIVRVAGSKQEVKSDFTGHTYTVDGKEVTGLNLWTVPTEVATAAELTAAVADAKVDTIVLTENITDTAADITLGKRTLELSGKTLTLNSIVATSGNVNDATNEFGKLVVGTTEGKANAAFRSANKQLAVGDANGIWFTEISNAAKFEQKDANVATYAFNFYLRNPNAKAYLIANPTAASIGATTVVYIDGAKKDKAFGVKNVTGLADGEHPVAYLLQNPANGVKLTMKGIAEFENAAVNGWISVNGTAKAFKSYTMNPSAS